MGHADDVWAGLVERGRTRAVQARPSSPRGGTPTPTSAAQVETFADMSKSRALGFLDYQDSAPVVPRPVRHAARAEDHPVAVSRGGRARSASASHARMHRTEGRPTLAAR